MTLGQRAPSLDAIARVSHRFFGRVGGTSPAPFTGLNVAHKIGDAPARVDENLARVRFQIGVGPGRLYTATQVHGARALEVKAGDDVDAVGAEEADALFTLDDDVAIGVRTADCVPILVAAKDGGAVAAVHAGWRGAVGGVIESTVRAMGERGVDVGALVAAVGPCISQDAFEVGPEVIEQAAARADLDGLVRAGEGDRQHLDLRGLCARVLEGLKVSVEHVEGCTVSDPERYFSHRRDQGRTGRQLAAIARTEPPVLSPEMFA